MKKVVYRYDLYGNYICEYLSQVDAALAIGVSETSIRRVLRGETKSVGGNIFYNKKIDDVSNLEKTSILEGISIKDVNHYWYKGEHYSIHAKRPVFDAEAQFNVLLDELRSEGSCIKDVDDHTLNGSGNCAIINIYDMHLDKRDINFPELGSDQVDCVVSDIEYGVGNLLDSIAPNNPDTFIFPIGNDMFTTNGFSNCTKKGTPQDPVTVQEYTFKAGLNMVRNIIDTLVETGSSIYIPIIYGNHGSDTEFFLGSCLEILYEKNKNVFIDNKRIPRKYCVYGSSLFGFSHGDNEKKRINQLPLIMATEQPIKWGEAKHRIFYLGDVHHKEEYKFFRTKDNAGCTVQFLRSAGVTDAWHNENGFIGIPRTIEASVWNSVRGQIANYTINI